MQVVILGTAWPYRGGLAAFNERLAKQFVQEGHEVKVITFTLQYPSFLFPGKTQYSQESAPEGITIAREVNSCNPLNWIKVGRQLKKQAPDILISCYWMAFFAPCYGVIQRIVRRNGKTKCMALVHNMIPHEPSVLDKCLAPFYVRQTDGFVALSESVVRDIEMLDSCGKPKAFSPHPVYDHYGEKMDKQEACKALGLDADKRYMLFFGLVRAYKGLDLLLGAFGRVKEELGDLQLIVAGEFYEDEDKYRKQIADNGLTDRVMVKNEFVADGDLRKYFGAADLIVQPYKSATQSGVTQVAFHFEKPALVTNVGGLGEIIHDGKMGYAVAPEVEAIADSLRDYYQNDRQAAFTAYLVEEKKKYEWDKMTNTYYTVYQQIKK